MTHAWIQLAAAGGAFAALALLGRHLSKEPAS
ncbi:hypothetical protein GGE06_005910 [Streptomyces sp. SFB5A]|uniref:Uncharacterized protein n=1 Tax=Streptomyces nymphaeiformis TaxID=2663842 RepID=A0A7W7U7B3_9ACTN|nr:hypothetical protein [Streptomyces nymphaeiformis]